MSNEAVQLKKNQSALTRKCRDLLHIAGMGSSLGVGFNPGSPDKIIPKLIIMEIMMITIFLCTFTMVILMGSMQVLLIPGNKQLPRENRLRG